jgi:hypothetical protein
MYLAYCVLFHIKIAGRTVERGQKKAWRGLSTEPEKDWTLDDLKNVLWSDETSVVFGQRRGGERVWRTIYERNDKTIIRNRFGGHSKFMFWGCFSYNYQGPCHLWQKETAAEKRVAEKDLAQRNQQIESQCKQDCWITSSKGFSLPL